MRFVETPLAGAYLIELDVLEDHRGFNARAWCSRTFAEHGLVERLVQTNIIWNERAGTMRGFHYQLPPHAETKLFRCIRGSLYDVMVDLRPESPTYGQSYGVTLGERVPRMLYVPERFGQGFLTLEDDTELMYQVSEFYTPDAGRGFRWDDPAFGIQWPRAVQVISDKDAGWPDFDFAAHELEMGEVVA